MKLHLFIFAFFIFSACGAQVNLVPNPSFELYNRIPAEIGDAPGAIQNWIFASEGGSGDYYHAKSPGPDYTTIDNYFGSEAPHSGEAYAGFCVTQTYREFLAAPLTSRLIKGQQYRFTMYISKGDHQDVSYLKEISVMFLSRKWILNDDLEMGLPPQIIFYQDTGFTQHNGWQELTAIYTARGNEQWIYIGAHQWKCDTCKSVPGAPRTESPWIYGAGTQHAHYYVDDVSLVEVTPENPVVIDTATTGITPTFRPGVTYSTSDVYFQTNSAVLRDTFLSALEPVIQYLKDHPAMTVKIGGHTDSIGTTQNNYNLSLARADAVKKYLVDHGVAAARITTKGYGESMPAASNSTEEGRARNRRVEFTFTDKDVK